MKLKFAIIAIMLAVAVTGCGSDDSYGVPTKQDIEAKRIAELKIISTDCKSFSDKYKEMTDVQKGIYWSEKKGSVVEWTGTVYDVSESSVSVSCGNAIIKTKDIVAKIMDNQKGGLIRLNKGDKIVVRGSLTEKGGLLSAWTLSDAVIER